MDKETINTLFEGTISIIGLVGCGFMASMHPDNVAIIGLVSAVGMAIVTHWFGQRGVTKAINGSINAMAQIASQVQPPTVAVVPSVPVAAVPTAPIEGGIGGRAGS